VVEALNLALPDAVDGTAALRLPRRRRGGAALAAVVLCPDLPGTDDPDDGPSAATTEWIADGLTQGGIATCLPAPSPGDGPSRVDAQLATVRAIVAQLRRTSPIDPSQIGVLGLGRAAALACVVGAEPGMAKVAMVAPVAPEIVVRRLDRLAERAIESRAAASAGVEPRRRTTSTFPAPPGESADAATARRLAALQPLRALAQAPPRPTLIVHSATDERDGPEHAQAIAMALRLDGRHVDVLAVGFVGATFAVGEEDAPLREAVVAPLVDFFRSAARP